MKVGVFGLGNMGSALIGGILKNRLLSEQDIVGCDILPEKRDFVEVKYKIACKNEEQVCDFSDILFMAVKPSDLSLLLEGIKEKLSEKLIFSICAGISINYIEKIIGSDKKVARAMSNVPLIVGAGASCVAYNAHVKDDEKKFILKLLEEVGIAIELEETLMDAVTGLSGSGPAYIFILIEALADGGVKAGLPRDIALKLAGQTVFGSAKFFLESGKHPAELKDMVTSPGGTTIEGMTVLEQYSFRGALIDAVFQATEQSKKLGQH